MNSGSDKHHMLIEPLPDAFAYHKIVTDSEGKPVDYIFLDVNPAFEQMTGRKKDEVVGKHVTEIFPGIENEGFDWIGTYGRVALDEETTRFEQYFEIAKRWYEVTAYSDKPGCFAAIFKDITDRKEKEIMQETARKSQQLAQSVLDSVNANICVLDEQGYIIATNQSWFDFAVSNGAAIEHVRPGVNYLEICDQVEGEERETAERFALGVRELIRREREHFYMEYPCDAPDKKRWFLCEATYCFDLTLNSPLVVVTHIDITERRQAEKALRQSEERFHKMLAVVPDMISIHDPQMNILYSNWNGFAAVPEEKRKLNTKCYQTYRGLDHICPDCQAISVLQTGEPYQAEHELPEGTWVDLRILPVLDDNNKVELIVEWVQDITGRKMAEETLRESEENLAITLNSIGDAVIATDAEGLIVRMNPVAEKLCAWPSAEALGRPLVDVFRIIDAGTRQPVADPVKTVLQTGKVVGLANHTTLIAKDGSEYQIADSAAPIVTPDGRITGVVLVFHDVSEDYRLRQQIKESEMRWQFALEGAGDGVWDWNAVTNEVYFSRQWKKMLGYEEYEVGTPLDEWNKRIHPEDKARCYQDLEKHFSGKTPVYQNEHRMLCKDGTYKWILDRGKVLEWAVDGKPLRVIGTHADITERKEAEEALRRREEEFRALAENAPDIVVRFDKNLRHLYVNPALEKEVGIPRHEFIGRTNEDFNLPVEQRMFRNSTLQEVFNSGQEKEVYFDYSLPSGQKHYHSRIVPEFDREGEVETVLAITRDITAIKEMEAALYEERAKAYRMHQRSLPDDLPEMDGLVLSSCYRPAAKPQGDYYNGIRRHNQLLFYLVDTEEGRDDGVMQSLYVRNTIEEYLRAHDDYAPVSPGTLLRYLTERYQQEGREEAVPLCVFIAVFEKDPAAGEESNPATDSFRPEVLRYASRGFCTPPLLIKAASNPDEISLENLYLTLDDGTDFTEHFLPVTPGSIFIFGTDGLFNQGPHRAFYEQRLQEVLRDCAHRPPELISEAVEAGIDEFCSESGLRNDLALIVAQVPGREQRLRVKVESDFDQVLCAREKVSTFLEQQLGYELDLLPFHELLVNAIEHGNKQDGGKTAAVDLVLTDSFYKFVITDQGEGFNWRNRIHRELELDGDSERGRGIIMTRMMTDYLGYNERGNRVTMINLLEQEQAEQF